MTTSTAGSAALAQSHIPTPLAEKILNSKSSLEGERKFVTVLFADIRGSLELIAARDAEGARKILDEVLRLMIDAVHRYEGTVNQVLGDGIMALFGAPLAHEDHAERACHAALAIQKAVSARSGTPIQVRVGLNSGEVIVRSIRSDLHMDYTAVGRTTHLAARMEQGAPPNAIYLTNSTWRLARSVFSAVPAGSRSIKGLARPIAVFSLAGLKNSTTSGPFRPRKRLSQFVGRDSELSALEQALEGSLSGDVRVVGVVGHPGVGKSRLCYELAERCRSRGIPVLFARGVSHGRSIPLLPILDFLRRYFGIAAANDRHAARQKVEEKMLGLDQALAPDLSLMLEFLGISESGESTATTDPSVQQRKLLDAVKRMVRLGTRNTASVFVVEDLQWLDVGSEMFVEALIDALPGSRALVVVNFRLPYAAPWMQRSYYQQLPIFPLRPLAAEVLVRDLLGSDPSVTTLAREILNQSGGNPFFIEELVRASVETGYLRGRRGAHKRIRTASRLQLPGTVMAVLSSRIDRLTDTEKELLQTAAVVGKEFSVAVLKRVVQLSDQVLETGLRRLEAAEFIVARARTGEDVYSFTHPLTQEVAYSSQLHQRRRRLHADVARAIEELNPDRVDEMAGLIAAHQEAGGDAMSAALSSVRAAIWVGSRNPSQALGYWGRVRDLLKTQPESSATTRWRLMAYAQLLNLGWREGITAEEAADSFTEASALARRTGEVRLHALIVAAYGRILAACGSADEYVAHVEAARELASGTPDSSVQVMILAILCQAYRMAGRLQAALSVSEQGLAAAQDGRRDNRLLGFSARTWLVGTRAQCLMYSGRVAEARATLDSLLELVENEPDLALRQQVRNAYVDLAGIDGDAELAALHASASSELAERSGSPYLQVYSQAMRGVSEIVAGNWDLACLALTRGLTLARETRSGLELEGRMLVELAKAQRGMGDWATAVDTVKAAVKVTHDRRRRVTECQAQVVLAGIEARFFGAPGRGRASIAVERAEVLLAETGAVTLEAQVRAVRADLAASEDSHANG